MFMILFSQGNIARLLPYDPSGLNSAGFPEMEESASTTIQIKVGI